MSNKSKRDIEFAVDTAIEVLRGAIASNKRQSTFVSDQGALPSDPQGGRTCSPHKHGRDLEKAIAILKAIKAGVYTGE